MREFIHTFQFSEYQQESFSLKANINEAFDKIECPFIRRALECIELSVSLIELIMSCMEEGEITTLINGKGDSFFKLTRRLR
jgi:hypothetical protein